MWKKNETRNPRSEIVAATSKVSKLSECIAISVYFIMALRGSTGNDCMVQISFTKWQDIILVIIHLLYPLKLTFIVITNIYKM